MEHEHVGHNHAHHEHDEHIPAHAQAAHPRKERTFLSMEHGPNAVHVGHHAHMMADFRRRFFVSLAVTLPVLALSPAVQRLFTDQTWIFPGINYVQLGLATAIFLYGGWPFLRGLVDELSHAQPGMMTLIALAITVAYSYSAAVVFGLSGEAFFWELATLIDVMLLGHWIEMRSVMGASRALEELVKLLPTEAHRLGIDGTIEDVPLAALRPGDQVVVKPGERIPADGVILTGRATVSEALLTGESRPVEKEAGNVVIGGAINGEGAVTVAVQKTEADTYISQVIALVRQAQESGSRTQDLANRAALWLTLIALGAGFGTLGGWLAAGEGLAFALSRMVTVMVITCPHALGLAAPLVVAQSTSLGARRGLLIRDRAAFERARNIQAVVFDKTGTLTQGRFGVTDVLSLGGLAEEKDSLFSEDEVLRLAAGLELQSEHPIAQGIVAEANRRGLALPRSRDFQALPGQGAQATLEDRDVKIVGPAYLAERGLKVAQERVERLAAAGKTAVYLIVDGVVAGVIALTDVIRPESREAVAKLKEMGIRVMMLTGDAEAVAHWVAGELGLDEYFSQVLPHEKAEKIREVRARGLHTAMVGDGVNDAPALAAADVGIAIGAGTDVAVESADIVLVRNDPRDVVTLIELARATYGKMLQNLGWATGYNAVAIPLAAGALYTFGVLLPPAVGAALMALSTIIVAINARLLRG